MSINRKILVVGGAGYVGTELTKKLLNLNYEVSVLDLFIYGEKFWVNIRTSPRLKET